MSKSNRKPSDENPPNPTPIFRCFPTRPADGRKKSAADLVYFGNCKTIRKARPRFSDGLTKGGYVRPDAANEQ